MIFELYSEVDFSNIILVRFNYTKINEILKQNNLFKIIWAKDDDLELQVDGYELKVNKGSIVFCTPDNIVQSKTFSSHIILLGFNKEFYCIRDHDNEVSCNGLLFYGTSIPPIIELKDFELKSFNLIHEMVREEFRMKDSLQGEMLRTLLKQILIMSTRMLKTTLSLHTINTSQLSIIRMFNQLVEMHFKKKHKVKEYAVLLNKSPKTLSNIFSKFNNRTPLQIIADRICIESQRLIMFSDLSLSEIAYELGFKEPSHFSKFFKKHYGKSPKEYKLLFNKVSI